MNASQDTSELNEAAIWDAGHSAGYRWALIEDPHMTPEEEATRPINPYLPASGSRAGGRGSAEHPQYARLKVVEGDITSFPIGERGFCGWHSGVMFYPDVLVESYTPLTVLTAEQGES